MHFIALLVVALVSRYTLAAPLATTDGYKQRENVNGGRYVDADVTAIFSNDALPEIGIVKRGPRTTERISRQRTANGRYLLSVLLRSLYAKL
jgi:hypothetical protein